MATTITLPFRRFAARVDTGSPEAKASYKALAQRNALALEECPWGEATGKTVKASLVEHDFTATFTDEKYDAFLMTGSYNSTANTEIAYAGMVAYRFALPQAYLAGSATLVSASLMLARDRFLLPGLRVSAVLSNSATPSTSWDVVRGDAEGCVKLAAQLANPAERITAAEQATGAVEVALAGLDATKKPYLWVYLTVEDYTATWTWYSSTQHRLYAIEGSGMVVAESSTVEFSADVAPDSGDSTISFPVVRHGITQSNFGVVSGMCGVAVLANGDGFDNLAVADVDGHRRYNLTPSQLDRYNRADTDPSDNYYIGLRALYARFYAGDMEMCEYQHDKNLRPGAGFSVRPESFTIEDTTVGRVTLRGWSLSASSVAIPFSMPSDFSTQRIAMSWGTDGNTTGGTVNGGKYNFWLKRGVYVDELPESLLKNPDIYIGEKAEVDGWEFLGRGDGGSVDFALATPLEGRVATVLVTAFVDQSANFAAGATGFTFAPRGASTELEIMPSATRDLTTDTTGAAVGGMAWLMKPDITLYGRSDTYDASLWTTNAVTIPNPLCFTAEQANSTVSMIHGLRAPDLSLLYSTDGENWTPFVVGETTVTLANVGDKVYLAAGPGGNLGCARGNSSNRFELTGRLSAHGDISSLLDNRHSVLDLTGRSYCYYALFGGCTSLVSAPTLPATTLADNCYYNMFKGCTSLTAAPTLPATTLADNCYSSMFNGCTSLTAAPALPATTLADNCYYYMFEGCTSLTAAPALPATTLADNCYYFMFNGCTSLTAAPTLPATTLAKDCYCFMFEGCTSLTAAPALPATTLAESCYYGMFKGCTSLNKVTTAQTTFDGCDEWLSGVAASGTFKCPAALGTNSTIARGESACPTGWTVENT